MELEVPPARRNACVRTKRRTVDQDLLDDDRRRNLVHHHAVRVYDRNTLEGREPQSAVAASPAWRLRAADALAALHAIRLAVGDRRNGRDLSISEIVQVLFADSKDPAGAAHPEIAPAILEDHPDHIVEQAVAGRI